MINVVIIKDDKDISIKLANMLSIEKEIKVLKLINKEYEVIDD